MCVCLRHLSYVESNLKDLNLTGIVYKNHLFRLSFWRKAGSPRSRNATISIADQRSYASSFLAHCSTLSSIASKSLRFNSRPFITTRGICRRRQAADGDEKQSIFKAHVNPQLRRRSGITNAGDQPRAAALDDERLRHCASAASPCYASSNIRDSPYLRRSLGMVFRSLSLRCGYAKDVATPCHLSTRHA